MLIPERSSLRNPTGQDCGASEFVSYLRALPDETLYYKPNPGNGGDALIAHSTFETFRELGISFRTVSGEEDLSGKVVLAGGGGNFVQHYTDCSDFVARHHGSAKKLVILPQTVQSHEKLLAELRDNVDIICRERTSYEHAVRSAPRANVLLMDDLAFGLDVSRTLSAIRGVPFWPGCTSHRRSLKILKRLGSFRALLMLKKLSGLLHGSTGRGVLYGLRSDVEKTAMKPGGFNMDISAYVRFYDVCPHAAESLAHRLSYHFLRSMSGYSVIHTNRLHMCIAGALLGKRVCFYPNSYWKNRAVYEFSIKDRFPNVQWMGD